MQLPAVNLKRSAGPMPEDAAERERPLRLDAAPERGTRKLWENAEKGRRAAAPWAGDAQGKCRRRGPLIPAIQGCNGPRDRGHRRALRPRWKGHRTMRCLACPAPSRSSYGARSRGAIPWPRRCINAGGAACESSMASGPRPAEEGQRGPWFAREPGATRRERAPGGARE